MIGANAVKSFERLLDRALHDHCSADPADRCVVKFLPLGAPPQLKPAEMANRRLISLGISSYLFRVVLLFDFASDPATRQYLARSARIDTPMLDGKALNDAYGEFVNMVCGAVNRGLHGEFRHSGMSTPFALESSCCNYLEILQPDAVLTATATINDDVQLRVIAALCGAADVELDFSIETAALAEANSGELELF